MLSIIQITRIRVCEIFECVKEEPIINNSIFVHTNPEVMIMERDNQKSTKEMEEAIECEETFNPLWNEGEFLGPNAVRYKNVEDEREKQ